MENLPPFYVGQRVVALRDFIHSGIKEGDTFIVIGINKFCKCAWAIDVGLVSYMNGRYCNTCGYEEVTNIAWLSAHGFAPIQENFESISYEKVMEEELISVN